MKVAVVICAVLAVANAGLIGAPGAAVVRAPSFDSAVIQSDRIGGNFAYSVAENHAYAAISPIVQNVATPVAVSYSAPAVVAAPAVAPIAYGAQALAGPAVVGVPAVSGVYANHVGVAPVGGVVVAK